MAGDNGQAKDYKPKYEGVIGEGSNLAELFGRPALNSNEGGFGAAYRAMVQRREQSPDHIDHGIEPVPKGLDKKVEESQ